MRKYLILILIIMFLTGCTVKQNDLLIVKATKHTVNSPEYFIDEVVPVLTNVVIIVGIIGLQILAQSALYNSGYKNGYYYHNY